MWWRDIGAAAAGDPVRAQGWPLRRASAGVSRCYGANPARKCAPEVTGPLVSELRAHRRGALVALDFDGTLAPIVPDPEQSRLVDGAREAISGLVAAGAHVAILTGRDAPTVLRLSGLAEVPGLYVEGLYGAQSWHDGTLDSPPEPLAILELRPRLRDLIQRRAGRPGVWVEDKSLSLVVHARRTDDPPAALAPLRDPLADLARELGLETHPGRGVIELRLPGYDKGGALRRLVRRLSPSAVLSVGDDVGDLPAFAVVAQLRAAGTPAWAVAVASPEAPEIAAAADVAVPAPADVVALLAAVAAA